MPLLLVLLLLFSSANSQQDYLESDQQGYTCVTDTTVCRAYASYRALRGDTLRSVGPRFGSSAEEVAAASQIPVDTSLTADRLLLIPLNCSCASGRSQHNVTYVVQSQETYSIIANATFQGLTTFQAAERATGIAPTQLGVGDGIVIPIRCACPSSSQESAGVRSLVTYGVWPGDTLGGIASSWRVALAQINSANNLSSGRVQDFTTLLLPSTQDRPELPEYQALAPPPPPASPPPSAPSPGSSNRTGAYVGIAVGCVAAVLLIVVAVVVLRRRRSRKASVVSGADSNFEKFDHIQVSVVAPSSQESLLAGLNELVDSEKPIQYSYQELRDATDNFSAAHLIQGSVYRGVLRTQLVAIKEMKGGTTSHEIKTLSKLHHSNLVRLVGLCSGADSLFLVYEYAENGSLSSCLHTTLQRSQNRWSQENLSWNKRLQIALDVASGLDYIHSYTKPSFVHKDVKSSNILLDGDLRAKIANFGMARVVNDAALTKHIAGTQGYMSPEYLAHGFVTAKVDVYAFGVVVLELFTGREAVLGPEKQYLADEFAAFLGDEDDKKIEKLKRWADPLLGDAMPWKIALRFVELAASCVDVDPDARPNFEEVTYELSKIMESSLQWETTKAKPTNTF